MATPTTAQSTHPFTCNTCQVAFRSSELQRTHMQTDWHRYNLKRRVASLPPLSSEIFAEKVLANKASAAATAARASFEKSCQVCQKTYYSENAFNNHLASQKHKQNASKAQKRKPESAVADEDAGSIMSSTFSLGEPIESVKSIDEDAEEEFSEIVHGMKEAALEDKQIESPVSRRPTRPHHSSQAERESHPLSATTTNSSASDKNGEQDKDALQQCLFCNFSSPNFKLNLLHMQRYHSLFIPEQEYLVDTEGLIQYLSGKIQQGHECLYCGKVRNNAEGIQTHMRDTGHCKIAYSTEEEMLEIGEFYDFRRTYSDDEGDSDDEMTDTEPNGGVKLGAPRQTTTTIEMEGSDDDAAMPPAEDDEAWESSSTLSSVPTEELTSIPLADRSHRYKSLSKHRHHSHSDPRPHKQTDGFHSRAHATPHAVYHDDYELHLPSGRTAGHRSLNKYFRQNLRHYPTPAERAEQSALEAGRHVSDDEGDEAMPDADADAPSEERGRSGALVSRANGGLGMLGVTEVKKREVRAVQHRERKREMRDRARYAWGNEKRANMQKHYRDPLLQ